MKSNALEVTESENVKEKWGEDSVVKLKHLLWNQGDLSSDPQTSCQANMTAAYNPSTGEVEIWEWFSWETGQFDQLELGSSIEKLSISE